MRIMRQNGKARGAPVSDMGLVKGGFSEFSDPLTRANGIHFSHYKKRTVSALAVSAGDGRRRLQFPVHVRFLAGFPLSHLKCWDSESTGRKETEPQHRSRGELGRGWAQSGCARFRKGSPLDRCKRGVKVSNRSTHETKGFTQRGRGAEPERVYSQKLPIRFNAGDVFPIGVV